MSSQSTNQWHGIPLAVKQLEAVETIMSASTKALSREVALALDQLRAVISDLRDMTPAVEPNSGQGPRVTEMDRLLFRRITCQSSPTVIYELIAGFREHSELVAVERATKPS